MIGLECSMGLTFQGRVRFGYGLVYHFSTQTSSDILGFHFPSLPPYIPMVSDPGLYRTDAIASPWWKREGYTFEELCRTVGPIAESYG